MCLEICELGHACFITACQTALKKAKAKFKRRNTKAIFIVWIYIIKILVKYIFFNEDLVFLIEKIDGN